ncbi:MAG: hypothetical protein ACRC7N_15405 [Clostridium sp.]
MKSIVIDKTPYDYYVELPDGSIKFTIGNINANIGDSLPLSTDCLSHSSNIKFDNKFDYL